MAEKCQVCGGKVVNGRCSLCGMPYRNDDVLYHLNEPREVHYKHASAKVREMMRGYGTADRNAGHGSGTGTSRGRMQEQRQQSAGKNPVMKQTGTSDKGRTTNQGRTVNRGRIADQGRTVNQRGILNQGKTQSAQKEKSGGKGWIIWLIIGLLCAIPGVLDTIMDWIGTNL